MPSNLDPFDVLRRRYRRLSAGQRRVARQLLDAPHEVMLLSTEALGRRVGVSDSTVVRLATALGYDGYPSLRTAIHRSLYQHIPPSEQFRKVLRENRASFDDSIHADLFNLSQLDTESARSAIAEAAEAVAIASAVYAVGFHSSFAPAYELSYLLGKIRPNVHCITTSSGDLAQQLAGMTSTAAVVAFSLPRYSLDTFRVAEHAQAVAAKLIVVTESLASPLAQLGGTAITVSTRSASFFHSQVAAIAVGNVIAAEIAKRSPGEAERRLKWIESMNRRLGEFLIESPELASDGTSPDAEGISLVKE